MKTLLAAIIAGMFALAVSAPVIAAEKKGDPVAAACKGKKPGEEVTVDGKKVKCPAPAKK